MFDFDNRTAMLEIVVRRNYLRYEEEGRTLQGIGSDIYMMVSNLGTLVKDLLFVPVPARKFPRM